jgi:KDO2-lipid IV(A) lauroyltransferase
MNHTALQFWQPRYWLVWFGLTIAWLLARLPLVVLWRVGQALGWLLYHLAHHRRSYAQRNLALCFPLLSSYEQSVLLKEHFSQLGMSLMETIAVWFGRASDFTARCDLHGREHLTAAQATGQGIIVCVFHNVHMEAMGLLAGHVAPIHPVYRPHENALLEWFMARNRSRHTAGAISNRKIKDILANLHQGNMVWLSPDQRNRGDGIIIPFFGHDTLTHPSIARIARLTHARLLPMVCHLNTKGRFQLSFLPMLDDFPGKDDTIALTRIMHLLETDIAQAPAQYLWVHNRFNLDD